VARVSETWLDETNVYVYFNNDHGGSAVMNSAQFARLACQAGRGVTRTPEAGEVTGTAASAATEIQPGCNPAAT
jgi:uncharacterized protein YecE (DUF72 family)